MAEEHAGLMSLRKAILIGVVGVGLAACEPVDPTVKAPPIVIVSEKPGFGPPAEHGDLVTIKYRLSTPQGKLILKDDEFRFILGSDSVFSGVDEAVTGMSLRGERVVDCPPHKHWGRPGYGNGAVPANTNLIIEIELVHID